VCADGPKDEKIKDELGKAKLAFEQSKSDAKKLLIAAFEKAEEAVQSNKGLSGEQKLTQIQQLRDEKKTFQEDGKLPTAARLKSAVEAHQQAMNTASKKLEKAFDLAIEGYVKLDDLDAAKAILSEKKAVSDAKPAIVKKPDPPTKKPDSPVPANLLGRWDVRLEGTEFKTVWTFDGDGTVKSSEGDITTGKWKVEKDKKWVRIAWDGSDLWDALFLPLDPKMSIGDSVHRKRVVAVKQKD
jgi:hypothetical protein